MQTFWSSLLSLAAKKLRHSRDVLYGTALSKPRRRVASFLSASASKEEEEEGRGILMFLLTLNKVWKRPPARSFLRLHIGRSWKEEAHNSFVGRRWNVHFSVPRCLQQKKELFMLRELHSLASFSFLSGQEINSADAENYPS